MISVIPSTWQSLPQRMNPALIQLGPGYAFGRIGNFINGELFGRLTQSPIGMHFPLPLTPGLRYPPQLSEAFFEGVFLFPILWSIRKAEAPKGFFLGAYLIGYDGGLGLLVPVLRFQPAGRGLMNGIA